MNFHDEDFQSYIDSICPKNTPAELESMDIYDIVENAPNTMVVENGTVDYDEDEMEEAVDENGLTETERVLLSLVVVEEVNKEEPEEKVEEKPSKYEKKSGPKIGKGRFTNKHFKNRRNRRGGRGRGGKR